MCLHVNVRRLYCYSILLQFIFVMIIVSCFISCDDNWLSVRLLLVKQLHIVVYTFMNIQLRCNRNVQSECEQFVGFKHVC